MMEILRGSPALSAFRINKLLARFQAANLPVSAIYAEYIHFADLNASFQGEPGGETGVIIVNPAPRRNRLRRNKIIDAVYQ